MTVICYQNSGTDRIAYSFQAIMPWVLLNLSYPLNVGLHINGLGRGYVADIVYTQIGILGLGVWWTHV